MVYFVDRHHRLDHLKLFKKIQITRKKIFICRKSTVGLVNI